MLLKKLLLVASVLVCLAGRHDTVFAAADREDSGLSPSGPLAAVVNGYEVGDHSGGDPDSADEAYSRDEIAMSVSDRPKDGARILIVFFSRVGSSKPFTGVDAVSSASLPQGNTIVIANMIHDFVGGDMFQIVTVDSYPSDYHETTEVARMEQNHNARPKLSTHVARMKDYDTIFLGYPIWWGRMPMALFSFLEEYDLSGKTIIPFCTHGGSGLGSSEKDIASLCPRSRLLRGLAIPGSSAGLARNEVSDWLAELGYNRAK